MLPTGKGECISRKIGWGESIFSSKSTVNSPLQVPSEDRSEILKIESSWDQVYSKSSEESGTQDIGGKLRFF